MIIVVDPEIGREYNVAISNREIIEISDFILEKAIYYDLYPVLSGFVHPNLMRVVSTRSDNKRGTLTEGDPIRSAIFVASVCILLLLEIRTSKFLKRRTKRDLSYILKTFIRTLVELIKSETLAARRVIPTSIYNLFGFEIEEPVP